METVSHGISLPAASRFTDAFAATSCSTPRYSGYRIQQWIISARMSGELSKTSVGRQSQHCKICRHPCNGWQPEKANLKGNGKEHSRIVTGALPTVLTGTATALIVGGAIFALTRLNKDSLPVLETKKECEVCGGSGVCPTCNGEGFVNKNLSTEAAARARATAKDAATRYTAGLAKKWNYCATCAGQRGCQSCDGRGWVRMCMCMCLRARQRERRERSTKAADVELFPVLDSSNSSCLAKVKQDLRMVPKDTQFFESYILSRPSLPCVLTAADLESNLGPFSPKRVPVEFKDPLQDKFFQTRLRMGLRWLSNNFHGHYQEFLNRIENETAKNETAEQEEPTLILKERGEGAEQLTSSSISQFPPFTIAWSECDSCVAEFPSCKAQQRIADGRVHVDVAELDEKLKTLVDEIIETDQTNCSCAECLADFEDTCQCSQFLPNQIVATSACTTNFWIKQDFQAGVTTRMPGEQRDTCTMTEESGGQRVYQV